MLRCFPVLAIKYFRQICRLKENTKFSKTLDQITAVSFTENKIRALGYTLEHTKSFVSLLIHERTKAVK